MPGSKNSRFYFTSLLAGHIEFSLPGIDSVFLDDIIYLMIWTPFKARPKRFLGVDIGTSAIKIVELSGSGERIKLENYGEMSFPLDDKPFRAFGKTTLLLSEQDIGKVIRSIFATAKIEARNAIFSLPDYSSFFTFLDLPPMSREEIDSAVRFKAREHVPLPLSEVTLDWSLINGEILERKKSTNLNVLLVAVPHEVINQYQEIARLSQIRLLALEAEVFGLIRSLIKGQNKKCTICLVDFGAQSSTISIIENGSLKITHSFDVSGNELTRILSKSLNISYNEAEEMKKREGITSLDTQAGRVVFPLIDLLLVELERTCRKFYQGGGKEIEKIIVAGGSSFLAGFKEYVSEWIKKPVEMANPFAELFYPPALDQTLKEMGPSYAIAVGMALRGFEKL